MTRARDLSLALAIFVWATILGGIVYSHMVWFPPYLAGLPQTSALATTIHDEHFWTTVHPLAILSLAAAVALNWKLRARRNLILVTIVIYAVAIITTSPTAAPAATGMTERRRIDRTTARGVAPRAIRTPISNCRCTTACVTIE